jgi:hypothetical protein
VCEDHAWENWLIGVISFFIATFICVQVHECCVKGACQTVEKSSSTGAGGEEMMSMLETMHSTMPGGGVTGLPGDFEVKTETTTISYNGRMMSLANFVQTAIVTFVVVHCVYLIYRSMASAIFNTTDDGFWNSIDLEKCPLSLVPIAIAIWLMLWISLSYYYGNATYTYRKQESKLPLMVGGQMTVGGGGGGFFGGWLF